MINPLLWPSSSPSIRWTHDQVPKVPKRQAPAPTPLGQIQVGPGLGAARWTLHHGSPTGGSAGENTQNRASVSNSKFRIKKKLTLARKSSILPRHKPFRSFRHMISIMIGSRNKLDQFLQDASWIISFNF